MKKMTRNRAKNIKKASGLATLALGGLTALAATGAGLSRSVNPLFDSKISVSADGRDLEVPVYSLRRVGPGRCSAYVRMAAEELFGIEYSYSDGWDRKYKDSVVTSVANVKNPNQKLEELERTGVLRPGMLVGAFYPGSPHLEKIDSEGNYTRYSYPTLFRKK
jgi:hypothetical protein